MLQITKNNIPRGLLLFFFVMLLVLVRVFENHLFYDPFTDYFKAEFSNLPYPEYNSFSLYFNWILRYFINGLLSLLILYVLFKEIAIVRFSAVLLLFFLAVLLLLLFVFLNCFDEDQKMTFFYIRRFVIHPLFLLLFIPAFFYQRKNS